jgi:hypothetical protein
MVIVALVCKYAKNHCVVYVKMGWYENYFNKLLFENIILERHTHIQFTYRINARRKYINT